MGLLVTAKAFRGTPKYLAGLNTFTGSRTPKQSQGMKYMYIQDCLVAAVAKLVDYVVEPCQLRFGVYSSFKVIKCQSKVISASGEFLKYLVSAFHRSYASYFSLVAKSSCTYERQYPNCPLKKEIAPLYLALVRVCVYFVRSFEC